MPPSPWLKRNQKLICLCLRGVQRKARSQNAKALYPFRQSYNFLVGREVQQAMSDLEQIEAAILSLPSSEFEQLRLWFLDLDYERWDEQIEQDIEDGKLEAFAQEAIAEFEAGHCREI
jgi:hypothetical protein